MKEILKYLHVSILEDKAMNNIGTKNLKENYLVQNKQEPYSKKMPALLSTRLRLHWSKKKGDE